MASTVPTEERQVARAQTNPTTALTRFRRIRRFLLPWCCDSEPEVDDDFENPLCDSKTEASWNNEIEVSDCGNSDFEDAPEASLRWHGGLIDKLVDKVIEFRTKPTKCGSRSKTAVESTTYNKSRSQPAKPDGNVITHARSAARGCSPSSGAAHAHSYVTDSSRSTSVAHHLSTTSPWS